MTHSSHTRNSSSGSALHRSGEHRIFAGVAGGLGEHLGINAWWFRWAFIFLSLFAGVGLLVYVLAWITIPGPGQNDPIVSRWIRGVDWSDGGSVFGIVLVSVAGVLLLSRVIDVSGALVLAAIMFIVGLLLYRGDLKIPSGSGGGSTSPDAFVDAQVVDAPGVDETGADASGEGDVGDEAGAAGSVDTVDGDDVMASEASPASDVNQAYAPRPPRPPRERSILGRLTIAVGLIVIASIALVDVSALSVDIEPFHYFAAAMGVLGVGLLVGAWVGRARWLMIIGILIVPILWVSLLLPSSWSFSVGEFHHEPTTVLEVDSPYEQGIGQMTIDLTALSNEELGEIETVRASLGLGEMIVRIPPNVGVELNAQVGAGQVDGPFNAVDGVGIDLTRTFGPDPTVLVLDLQVGAGAIDITGPGPFSSLDNNALSFEGSNR